MIAGRRPLIRYAINVSPPRVTNHGVPIRNPCKGSSALVSRKFPIGSVIWKTHDVGSCTKSSTLWIWVSNQAWIVADLPPGVSSG